MEMIEELVERYPKLRLIEKSINQAYEIMRDSYAHGGKLLIAGNGGSAADSEHIVGELMKGFVLRRKIDDEFVGKLKEVDSALGEELANKLQGGLPAIALTGHTPLTTAFLNDVDGLVSMAQQLSVYGKPEDVFLGISTSGNSKNIMYAAITAKAKGMRTIALTGKDGGKLKDICDISVIVPETETYKIQELHLPIYHTWCLMLENCFFEK